MLYWTDQDTYEFTDFSRLNHIGIKLSGGADSAIVAYMIFKTIEEGKYNTKVSILTTVHEEKAYQKVYSDKVLMWLIKEFPNVKIGEHLTNTCPAFKVGNKWTSTEYHNRQDDLLDEAYLIGIERHYNGVTANPPKEVYEKFYESSGEVLHGGTPERDEPNQPVCNDNTNQPSYRPLINTNKRGVADLYKQYNLMDTLFNETRSCEAWTHNFDEHCNDCWFCKERKWGFGKL
jgi:hypothetical protein